MLKMLEHWVTILGIWDPKSSVQNLNIQIAELKDKILHDDAIIILILIFMIFPLNHLLDNRLVDLVEYLNGYPIEDANEIQFQLHITLLGEIVLIEFLYQGKETTNHSDC